MFKSMDKNNDGFVTRAEAQGTPHEKDFAAPEHSGEKAASGGASGSSGTKY